MKRYRQIDMLRAVAIIIVAMYHFWVVSGYQTTGIELFHRFLTYGGEIGVTMFFVISGFSIYCSLYQQEKRGEAVKYLPFIKKRLKRIYPSYFICILIVLLIGDGAVYISIQNIWSIVTHLLLVHNFFLSTHGSISGVLWTMGVIFQFYLISIPLYRCIKKRWIETFSLSVIISILMKFLLFSFFTKNELNSSYYFIYGRQLFSSLDNFIIGMGVAKAVMERKKDAKLINLFFTIASFFIWILYVTPRGVVYSNTVFGYVWHSITAVLIGLGIWQILMFENQKDNILGRGLVFIGKYEYEIYIWHLLIANNLYTKSSLIQGIAGRGYWGFAVVMMILSVGVGWIFNKMVAST